MREEIPLLLERCQMEDIKMFPLDLTLHNYVTANMTDDEIVKVIKLRLPVIRKQVDKSIKEIMMK